MRLNERTIMHRIKMSVLTLAVLGVAVVLAVMPPSQQREAEATPTGVIGFNSAICVTLGIAFGGLGQVDSISSCGNIAFQGSGQGIQKYVGCLRAVDSPTQLDPVADAAIIAAGYPNPVPRDGVRTCGEGVEYGDNGLLRPEPEDFAALDLDQNQLHPGQQLHVITFVDDDASVRFKTDEGEWLQTGTSEYICTTQDPDCDGDDSTEGDGVVVASLTVDQDVDPGTYTAVAIQEGIGWPLDFNVVGAPEEVTLTPLFGKPSLSTGATPPTPSTIENPNDPIPNDGLWDTVKGPSGPSTDCNFAATVDGVLGANGSAEKMVVVGKALDRDGNEVIGALLQWNVVWVDEPDADPPATDNPFTIDSDLAAVSTPLTPTIDAQALGVGFPNFLCGKDETGTLELSAKLTSSGLDPQTDEGETTTIEIEVVGPAENLSLAVNPASLACDGTASAAVTATVTTEDGEPAANGTDVEFEVQVLGTVSPLTADTGGGTATANVVPFAGVNTGVPVIVTVGDIQRSILVQCGPGSAPTTPGETPPPPGGGAGAGGQPPTGTVRPPDTGSGGDLDGRAALNVWGAVALFAGAMGLVGARVALRKV